MSKSNTREVGYLIAVDIEKRFLRPPVVIITLTDGSNVWRKKRAMSFVAKGLKVDL